jgi:phage shock protein E
MGRAGVPVLRKHNKRNETMTTKTQIAACILVVSLCHFFSPRGVQADDLAPTRDSIETVKKNLETGKAVLLDVREKREWDAGHLKHAELVPLSKLEAGEDPQKLAKKLDKKTIVYTHCMVGKRALRAGEILKAKGYEVRPLKHGFNELVKEGLEPAKK